MDLAPKHPKSICLKTKQKIMASVPKHPSDCKIVKPLCHELSAQSVSRGGYVSSITLTCSAQYPPVTVNTWSQEALVKSANYIEKPSVDVLTVRTGCRLTKLGMDMGTRTMSVPTAVSIERWKASIRVSKKTRM